MTAPDPHACFEELAVGHALCALEPDEEQSFLAHVRSCARCERDVLAHRETAAHLAYAAPSVELPPAVLAGIRAVTGGPAAVAPPPAPVVDLDSRRRKPPVWVGVAAAAALVVSLGVWNVDLQRDKADSVEYSGRLAAAVEALEAPGTQAVQLAAGGQVNAVALVDGKRVQLVVDGLPPNDRSRSTYVLWTKGRYGEVRAAGTFDVRHEGAHVAGTLTIASNDVSALMVTLEPGRKVPAVASNPLLSFGTLA